LTVSGGNTVTLDALAAGQKYCFHNVTISPGNLNIPSNLARPLVISMTGQWNSQGGSITNQTYIPANLQIESCYGSGGSVCGSSSGNGVRLQGNSIAYAVFYAPDADITCSPCNVGGAMVGKTFNEQGGSGQVHYDIALGDTPLLIGPPGTWTRNKWVIVQGN